MASCRSAAPAARARVTGRATALRGALYRSRMAPARRGVSSRLRPPRTPPPLRPRVRSHIAILIRWIVPGGQARHVHEQDPTLALSPPLSSKGRRFQRQVPFGHLSSEGTPLPTAGPLPSSNDSLLFFACTFAKELSWEGAVVRGNIEWPEASPRTTARVPFPRQGAHYR